MAVQPGIPGSPSAHAETVCEAFQLVVGAYPGKPAIRTWDDELLVTWKELDERIRPITAGLAALGFEKGDTLAMLLPNIPACHMIDFAAIHLGLCPFTIYNTSTPKQIVELFVNADAEVVFTQLDFLPKVVEARKDLPNLEHVVLVDTDEVFEGADMTLSQLIAGADPAFDFEASWKSVTADDHLCLIYTSGTTGPPKGVHWRHKTAMSQIRSLGAVTPYTSETVISFLPLAHAGGRITSHYCALPWGATITCCPVIIDFAKYAARYHPDALFLPPRMWEKLQVAIEGLIEQLPEEQKAEATAAVAKGVAKAESREAPDPMPESIRPILERLGLDRIKAAFVGGAPSAPELSAFFRAVGVPMLEAYGGTETGLCCFNTIEDFKGGTAGKPLPGVELRLLDDQVGDYEEGRVSNRGEILVRADMIMAGYRKEPEKTAATIDADGWLHSGDIGVVDEDGFLKIIDRKREIIISAAAKNMSPANIEQTIKAHTSLIGQIVCIGDGRRYNTALMTLDPEAAPMVAKRLGLEATELAEIIKEPAIVAEVQKAVDAGNAELSHVETIRKFTLLPDVWMPDTDVLTPTAKVKRRGVNARYASEIEELYAK